MRFVALLLACLAAWTIAACSTGAPVAEPVPTEAPPAPTEPPPPAPATPTTVVRAAPTATATTAPPPPTVTPTPIGYWPLDGAPMKPGDSLARRPIVAKIDNFPDARPPSGLSYADVVIEAPAEAGITRFDAVFHHDLPPVIGPIRSARLIDLSIAPWFNALFLHVGASEGVMARLRNSPVTDLDQFFHAGLYWRSTERPAPYNVYTDPAAVLEYADRLGLQSDTEVGKLGFDYAGATGIGGGPPTFGDRPGPSVRLNYSSAAQTAYVYDPERRLYPRSIGDVPHVDALTGRQIAAANVVVMETRVAETDIVEDAHGNLSLQIDTVGEGEVTIFRDGRAASGYWRRPSRGAMIELVDLEGRPLLLRPGQTWIQIIPAGMPFTN